MDLDFGDVGGLVDDVAATNACTVTTKPLILPKICESEVSYLFGKIFYVFLYFISPVILYFKQKWYLASDFSIT